MTVYKSSRTGEPDRIRISHLNGEEVTKIILSRQSKEPLTFSKEAGQWKMISPEQGAAALDKIDNLLKILRTTSQADYPVDHERLAEFGLKPPEITLRFDDLKIEFGTIAPINQQRYLRIGEKLHRVIDNFYHHLMAKKERYLKHSSR